MTKCTSRWGHSYQARYDMIPDTKIIDSVTECPVSGFLKIMEAFKTHIYVHDICTRCGDVIKREDGK